MGGRVTRVPARRGRAGLTAASVASLRSAMRGPLLLPADPGYDEYRRVWNAAIDRRPAVIARCTGTADVAAAVRFAVEADLEIAVRGGGHSPAGHSTTEGGMLIDLSLADGVSVDPRRRRARVQGGARLGALDHEAAAHGLAPTTGTVSHTGVGGLTLGGGYGFLSRVHGLACDSIISAVVVTASSEIVRASDRDNPELLWALRGGGGNFGVVTEFELRLFRQPAEMATGDLLLDAADALPALRAMVEYAPEMPRTMLVSAVVATSRAEWEVEGLEDGRPMVWVSWVFLGPQARGRRLAAPFSAGARPRATFERAMPHLELQRLNDESARPGRRRYWKGSHMGRMTDAGLEAFIQRGTDGDGPSPPWGGELFSIGGAIADVDEVDSAYSGRAALFDFLASATWDDPKQDAPIIDGARRYAASMAPHGLGTAYVNSLAESEDAGVRAAYGGAKYERLRAVKRHYDPDNRFHLNQNIRPNKGGRLTAGEKSWVGGDGGGLGSVHTAPSRRAPS